ncbi:IS3 family transposase [Kineococcus sp. SYSU DK005]|uniref:IS3 family transposase n=1 Tax=Kineococcus sp. SYSU DK005 TaxID=3383126 RepID=UPI003D7F09A5
MSAEVRHRGHGWNRKHVARLMRLAGIQGAHRRRRGKYGRRALSTATAPDLVQRRFGAVAPDRLWVADIPPARALGGAPTYLRTWEGFLYLAVVVDALPPRAGGAPADGWWVGRWLITCAPSWSWSPAGGRCPQRSGWRSPVASRRPA